MTKRTVKIASYSLVTTFLVLVAVLSVHIYLVTRPKPADASTIALARVDFGNKITTVDSIAITDFLYHQKGVGNVLCNPAGNLAVFTFYPVKNSAENIIMSLNKKLPFRGKRFLPSKDQIKSGCPVASTSITYKTVKFFNHLF